MIDLFSFGDPERWLIIFLISFSLYFLWSNSKASYDKRTKVLLTIPRLYIIVYNLLVISDLYTVFFGFNDLIRTGIGSVYGWLLLFGVEVYVRWINKKYGRC